MRVIRLLWESTDPYRALYYNLPDERIVTIRAHTRILEADRNRDPDRLVTELDHHRGRALELLRTILSDAGGRAE
jgi:DNA-binding GntR family transcriptional regulator